jgi:hypothetical protein
MMHRVAPSALFAVLLAACGGGPPPAPPAPPPFDPVGVYDVTVEAQGMSLAGVMAIEGSAADGYTGTIDTDMGGAAIVDISVVGQEVTFSIPDAGAQVRLVFEGSEFTGGLSGAMGDALIFGTRRDRR